MLERFWFGCGHCHGGEACPFAELPENNAAPPRTGLACLPIPLTAVMVFLLPLACAIGGAFLVGRLWAGAGFASLGCWQTAGMLAGLAAGVGLAKLSLRRMYRIWTNLNRGSE